MTHRTNEIAGWIRQRVNLAGARGLVVGLSGGLDSAVVVRLCQMAAPNHVVGVVMPCHSDPQDEVDARVIADAFSVPTVRVDLAPCFDRLTADLSAALTDLHADLAPPVSPDGEHARAALANVKPRLRMTSLYFVAASLDYLVAGTGNHSELTIGYFTKHGDGAADILPIGRLLKGEVRRLAVELGVPDTIIEKVPTAGLCAGQTDEADMGFSYDVLERYLTKGPEAVAPALAMRIERLVRSSEHKRALAPMPDE